MKTSPLLCLFLAVGLSSCVIEVPDSSITPPASPVTASSGVSQRIISDCEAALRRNFPTQQMSVISARQGENSYIVDFNVEGAERPWRCYHDGTKCTGTEYQGEG